MTEKLPVKISWFDNSRIEYLYAADGSKLRADYYRADGRLDNERYYCGGFEYELQGSGLVLMQFPFSEGRVVPTGQQFVYEYQMKDHLGNVRCSFRVNNSVAEVTQEDMYYPFGLSYRLHDGGQSNRYLYNGKEQESFNKLYWNDYSARFYDSQLGRWHVTDPADQFHSPYVYCANNPINRVDPDGCLDGDYYDKYWNYIGNDGINDNKIYQTTAEVMNANISENGIINWDGVRINSQYLGFANEVFKTNDKITNERILTLRPELRGKAFDFITRGSEIAGTPLRIAVGFRSKEEQNEIYKIGRTVPGAKVTWARGGESAHNYGLAFDIIGLKRGYDLMWNALGIYAYSIGLEWGGNWTGKKDRPHFQMYEWKNYINK